MSKGGDNILKIVGGVAFYVMRFSQIMIFHKNARHKTLLLPQFSTNKAKKIILMRTIHEFQIKILNITEVKFFVAFFIFYLLKSIIWLLKEKSLKKEMYICTM